MHPNVNITHLYQIKIQIQSLMQAWMFVFVKEQCFFQQYLYPAQIHNTSTLFTTIRTIYFFTVQGWEKHTAKFKKNSLTFKILEF